MAMYRLASGITRGYRSKKAPLVIDIMVCLSSIIMNNSGISQEMVIISTLSFIFSREHLVGAHFFLVQEQ